VLTVLELWSLADLTTGGSDMSKVLLMSICAIMIFNVNVSYGWMEQENSIQTEEMKTEDRFKAIEEKQWEMEWKLKNKERDDEINEIYKGK